ncbi:hypothetical protein cyc_09143 [Cyclospora cayetanensis]|uniref:Uncharacterized protein n=1 Tax=Cyclospora cayetanensis TaxID=88456 RepID=A0A1D3CS52_9EIME|nr:hypothetical protein cyc_09143 [Cyclospora cayetanensis]
MAFSCATLTRSLQALSNRTASNTGGWFPPVSEQQGLGLRSARCAPLAADAAFDTILSSSLLSPSLLSPFPLPSPRRARRVGGRLGGRSRLTAHPSP